MKRSIIRIDEEKCNGCGVCASGCPEGAIQIIDGKAKLVNEFFCDGLGACIGTCPQGAITIEEREAKRYEEKKVMENIIKQGKNTIRAHLKHLKDHAQTEYLKEALDFLKEKHIDVGFAENKKFQECGCPGSQIISTPSELQNWPIQLKLITPIAPYFENADLVIAADCVPFSYPNFHDRFLKGRILINFCPKLDQAPDLYLEKLTQIFKYNNTWSLALVHMEVPCCFGLVKIVEDAIKDSGKNILLKEYTISIQGNII
jgi:ferredoxin